MFSTLRTRFGIPGVISVIALVFAMFGGAYAASNSSNNGKATASAKAKKGPRGPKGATGPAGPAGAQGPAGAKGDAGANGSNGAAGATGPTGAKGATGAEGSPWTAGGTLPAGKTETGTWVANLGENASQTTVQISFPIPLATAPTNHVHLNYQETLASVGSGGCELQLESTTAKPIAPPDTLCVFTRYEPEEHPTTFQFFGSSGLEEGVTTTGTTMWLFDQTPGTLDMTNGTWAVTAAS
jgi:hypothetical protein